MKETVVNGYVTRIDVAFSFARELHKNLVREGTTIPYLSHLMSVASIVLDHGGDESEVIGAFFHDAAAAEGEAARLVTIRERHGDKVANIVRGCSFSYEVPRPPWKRRKEIYLVRLEVEWNTSVILVSCADNLDNLRALYKDYLNSGESIWERYSEGRENTIWYYEALLTVYGKHMVEKRLPERLFKELTVAMLDLKVEMIREEKGKT